MNEVVNLSNDLTTITAEINSYKQMAGQSIVEIGRRLNHVKENDLVHGQFQSWLEKTGLDIRTAQRMMKIASDNSLNTTMLSHLGTTALYEISTMPEEERQKEHIIPSTGESKTPDDMTVRELREVKKSLKQAEEEAEQARRSEQIALRQLEEAENREPEVVEKEVVPDDYDSLKGNYSTLKNSESYYKNQNEDLRSELANLEKMVKEASSSKENDSSQKDIAALENKKMELVQQIQASERIVELHEKAEELIHSFSPLKYSSDFETLKHDREMMAGFENTINGIERWCKEMKQEMPNKNIIEGEFIHD